MCMRNLFLTYKYVHVIDFTCYIIVDINEDIHLWKRLRTTDTHISLLKKYLL